MKGLFVTKWLHAIEKLQREGVQLDDSELANVESMYNFLKESGLEIDRRKSLAAELSRHWASFYDDTWVWGCESRSHEEVPLHFPKASEKYRC